MRAILGSLALLLAGTAADACSTVEGYRVPTNVELVEQADLVVLARVAAGPDTLQGRDRGEVPDTFYAVPTGSAGLIFRARAAKCASIPHAEHPYRCRARA